MQALQVIVCMCASPPLQCNHACCLHASQASPCIAAEPSHSLLLSAGGCLAHRAVPLCVRAAPHRLPGNLCWQNGELCGVHLAEGRLHSDAQLKRGGALVLSVLWELWQAWGQMALPREEPVFTLGGWQ